MASKGKKKRLLRRRKALHVRSRLRGSTERPRLSVFRSLSNIYCQVIDDESGRTLASASSCDKDLRDALKGVRKTDVASKVGGQLASKARAAGVTKVSFDRGSYRYHGRVKALAEAAREGGLEF
jgi:large subunit ribosomal protein L18